VHRRREGGLVIQPQVAAEPHEPQRARTP
jgi:hypothetical protein